MSHGQGVPPPSLRPSGGPRPNCKERACLRGGGVGRAAGAGAPGGPAHASTGPIRGLSFAPSETWRHAHRLDGGSIGAKESRLGFYFPL